MKQMLLETGGGRTELALLTDRERGKSAALITLTALWVLYFIPFLLRWQVW